MDLPSSLSSLSLSVTLSMAAFALAASLSPGPVNVMSLTHGAAHGFRPALRHVTGATVGFTLLLLLSGLGLAQVVIRFPVLEWVIRWVGVLFLLRMAWGLWGASGDPMTEAKGTRRPSLREGALMQWLNPKAWMAALAGMGTYVADGDPKRLSLFCLLYFGICFVSVGTWAYVGAHARRLLSQPGRVRLFNRGMASLLALGALAVALP